MFLINDNAAGIKVKVQTKAIKIPTDIIFPNSITGFNSPTSNDMKAMPVVKAAKKQGTIICLIAFLSLSVLSLNSSFNSLNLTST